MEDDKPLAQDVVVQDLPQQLSPETASSLPVGRDEMNLSEIPFTLLSNQPDIGTKTIRGPNWLIAGSEEFGLPLAIDEEVYVAMMKLTKDHEFRLRKIPFSRYGIMTLMGWKTSGGSYRRIRDALRRLTGVYIETRKFWDNTRKITVERGFHILDDFTLVDSSRGRKPGLDQTDLPLSTFTWSELIFDSFQAGYIKLLDMERYFRLTLPTSKRAFRYLDKRFYQRDSIEIDLNEYAYDCLGLSRKYRYPSKIKEKLDPSFEELIADGFLKSFSYKERKDSITIVIKRASPKKLRSGRKPEEQEEEIQVQPVHPLAEELVKRGVSEDVADDLVARYSLEQIGQKIEVFDWLMASGSPYVQDNPPGFLRKSIECNWQIPANFVSRAEKERHKVEGEAKKAEEERRQREMEENERLFQEREKRAEESPWRDLWQQVCKEIGAKIRPQSYQTWIAPCFIAAVEEGGTVVIDCPTQLIAEWVKESYYRMLRQIISQIQGVEHDVRFTAADIPGYSGEGLRSASN